MTSKGKELYHTIKRSLTSPPFSVGTSSSTTLSNGARYSGGSTTSKQWIHPPDILINGRVEYSLKMLGTTEVNEPKGTPAIRDAIHAIRFQLQVNKGITGHSGSKLKKVDIHISIDGLTVIDTKTKMILHKFPLHKISFCADDKQDKRVFSFIAKEEASQRHKCFVFLSDKLAEQITLTVGEAFDLAYQKFLEKNGRDLENRKQVIVLRKRIAELETENNELKEKLAAALRKNTVSANFWFIYLEDVIFLLQLSSVAPVLPSTPVPSQPPNLTLSSLITLNSNNSVMCPPSASTVPVPILQPPPSTVPRRNHALCTTQNVENIEDLNNAIPNVGRKLENICLDKLEDIFDNEFDPRADEKKKVDAKAKDEFGLDPFDDTVADTVFNAQESVDGVGNVAAALQEPTVEEFDHMLSIVDKRLAEMRAGFASGHLAVGDTGDSARDLQHIYGVPSSQNLTLDSSSAASPDKIPSSMS
uniref:PID domain-containing protein n=1 Tax=Syphacia muris TaxID=451379 RepID=A0A0N5AEC4_9BILA